MDPITHEAIDGLTAAMTALLPEPADPDLPPSVSVTPVTVSPTGLGGLAGVQRDPPGEILGRRLEAKVSVTVRVGHGADLGSAVASVAAGYLGAGRSVLAERGILRLSLAELGDVSVSGSGANQVAARAVEFTVLYEHLRRPEDAGETIDEVVIELDTSTSG